MRRLRGLLQDILGSRTPGPGCPVERAQQVASFQALHFTHVDARPREGREGAWAPCLPWLRL